MDCFSWGWPCLWGGIVLLDHSHLVRHNSPVLEYSVEGAPTCGEDLRAIC